jgi:hypothetical protein
MPSAGDEQEDTETRRQGETVTSEDKVTRRHGDKEKRHCRAVKVLR